MPENKVIIKQLIEFGLSDKEARIYLALLELEVATVTEIAKNTNIKRSSTYVVLDSLKEKGLVSMSEDKKVQNYIAISPDMLLLEAQNRAKKAKNIKEEINNIIPELKALHKDTKQRPKVKVFEGKQGLISSFEDTLNNKEKVMRVSSSVEKIAKTLPNYFPDYIQRRIKMGIKMYGIHPDDEAVRSIIKMIPKFDEPVLIPSKKYKFSADMAIYDQKIAYISTEKEMAIIIESKEIADVMKGIFDLAFEEAKRMKNINKLVGEYKESLKGYESK